MNQVNRIHECLTQAILGEGNLITVQAPEEQGWTARLHTHRRESLSCELQQLQVEQNWQGVNFAHWASETASKLTEVLEPMRVDEVEAEQGYVRLRSQQPRQIDDTGYYFELLLQNSAPLSLQRFKVTADKNSREAVPYPMTYEQLSQVIAACV